MSNFSDFISSGGSGSLPVNIVLTESQTWVPPVDGNICIHVIGGGGAGNSGTGIYYGGGATLYASTSQDSPTGGSGGIGGGGGGCRNQVNGRYRSGSGGDGIVIIQYLPA